jgi:hypothetical protein
MMGMGMVSQASYDVLKQEKEDLEEQLKLLRLKEVSTTAFSVFGCLSVEVVDDFNGDIHDFLTKLLTVVWRKFDVCEPCAAMWEAETQRSLRKLEGKMRQWTRTLPQNTLSDEGRRRSMLDLL